MPTTRLNFFPKTSRSWLSVIFRRATVIWALIFTAGIILARNEIESLGAYGYPAIFFTSLLSSATLIFPAPSLVLVLAMGHTANPVSLGLTAGIGAALGELTGYFVGYGGQAALEERPFMHYLERWMKKAGDLMIFTMAVIPNPLADVSGIIAGASKVPIWRFLLVTWLGKSLRFTLLASLGVLLR